VAKKMILCDKCNKEWMETASKYTDTESYRAIKGKARQDYKCDGCDKDLLVLSEVWAATNWLHSQDAQRGWETEFIFIKKEV
jgi:transposase-like protein